MKRIKKIGLFILLLVPIYLLICTPVNAVSGDYPYSNEVEDDYDSTFSSGGSSFDLTLGLVIIFIVGMFIVIFREALKAKKNINYNSMSTDVDSKIIEESGREHGEHVEVLDNNYDDVIERHIPTYTEEKLLNELYNKFCLVHKALVNDDKASLKRHCSHELYNHYIDDEVNGFDHFEKVDSNIRNIEEENGIVVIDMYLAITHADNQKKFDLEFILDKNSGGVCSHCGASLKGDVCDYCNSHVSNKNTFILNKCSNISD